MAISVVMPALEMAQETGKLVSWLKQEGEQVRKGEMLLEVETDKAVVEVEAAGDGILAGVTAIPGDVIPVGYTIAWLVQPGEAPPAAGRASAPTARRTDAAPAAAAASAQAGAAGSAPPPHRARVRDGDPGPAAAPRISPKARRLAQEHGVDVGRLKGSGPGGEILADDILKASGAGAASESPLVPPASPAAHALTTVGRLMAERTSQSWTTVPHFFVTREVDATALNAAREATAPSVERSHGVKVTHTDLLVAAVARVLTRHPRVNASWTAGGIVVHREVNVALALAVENAVVTGVVRGADAAPIGDIAARRRELTERARAGRLHPDDIAGATFTISNLGMYGVDAFTAIIVPPQAAILAVGAIADRVVAVDGRPAVKPMLTMTLSCDHRVVDGARAAEFMRDLAAALTSLNGGADL
ncbi:MAG: 2-oxo acid dehydrogenase subunit E2 [Acidobacteria bacterium]|nr:2-oxo acid dehydrogenase subunit E2 [Acidobacteriota bacterium]